MDKKNPESVPAKSRINRAQAGKAPRAARRKAPLAPEAVADFAGGPLAPETVAMPAPMPMPPPAEVAAAPAAKTSFAAAPEIEVIAHEEAEPAASLAHAERPRAWRTPWMERRPVEVVRDFVARAQDRVKALLAARMGRILDRVGWRPRWL